MSLVRHGKGDLAASLVLVIPLFLVYEVGVLFAGSVNGADVVTRALYGALGRSTYLMVNAAIAVAFLLWLRRGERWRTLRLDVVAPVVVEAAIYALALAVLGTVVVDRLGRLLGLGLGLGSVVDALGAGVHEELVFRLGVLGALVAIAERQARPAVALAFAIVASAALFAAAHHVGAYGEPFTSRAFAFRCVAGVVFGVVCWYRSLAHAVYAHALYDMLVYARM